jgi:hypothetical protein
VGAVAYEDGFLSLDLALWYALLFAVYAGQVALAFMLRRRAGPGLNTRQALALFTATGLAEGLAWSIGIVGVSATRPIEQELTVLLLGAGVAAGAALSFGFHTPTFLCRFRGATVPYVLWAIFRGDGLHLILALTVLIYSLSSIQMTLTIRPGLTQAARIQRARLLISKDFAESGRGSSATRERTYRSRMSPQVEWAPWAGQASGC